MQEFLQAMGGFINIIIIYKTAFETKNDPYQPYVRLKLDKNSSTGNPPSAQILIIIESEK